MSSRRSSHQPLQTSLTRLVVGMLMLLATYGILAATGQYVTRTPHDGNRPAPPGAGADPHVVAYPPRPAGLQPPTGPLAAIQWPAAAGPAIDPQVLEQAIRDATGYLVRSCDEQGRFVYELDLKTGQPVGQRYNVLRHAGAMYALAMAYRRDPAESTLQALRRAGGFLRRECLAPVPGEPDMLAIWSDPQVTGDPDQPREAKLGGTGLGLIALTELNQLAPGSVPIEDLRQLGNFLLYMQQPDGNFHSKMDATGRRDDRWTSLYYPGEASLGLLMLYQQDPQPKWLQAAADALGYLARPSAWQQPVLPDHWMLLAMARLLPQYNRCQPRRSRTDLLAHARRTCLGMIGEQTPNQGHPLLEGCFGDDGRTTPTATRLEGLLAALTFLPEEDSSARQRVKDSIETGVQFLLRCRIRQGPHAGAMPMAQGPLPASDPRSHRFNALARHVRIDYVQHALCAMILFEAKGKRPQINTDERR